jgi:RNA-directed DNA polymerase
MGTFYAFMLSENSASKILLERIVERRNMLGAMNRVIANNGAPGVDGMKATCLKRYLKWHWPKIRQDLLNGVYRPLPVRRKEIDKPDGGVRLLGIPTVLDRCIQQAIAQVLEQIWDPTFSEYSYGFRPGRSTHDAVLQAKGYLLDGYTHVIDMDLSKFFDRVNHDRLMSRLATGIRDKRVLKLIRRYLTAGAMIEGLVIPGIEWTP